MSLFKWFAGLFFWCCSGVSKLMRMHAKPDNEKILVIVLHKIGDSIFTIPAVNELIKLYKKEIYVLCFEEMLPIR